MILIMIMEMKLLVNRVRKNIFLIQSTPTKMDWPDAKTLTDSYYGARMYVVLNAEMEKKVYDALQSMNRLDGHFGWDYLRQK